MNDVVYFLIPAAIGLAYLAGYGAGYRASDESCDGGGWKDEALEWREIIKDAALRHIEYDCATAELDLQGELEVVDAQDKPA